MSSPNSKLQQCLEDEAKMTVLFSPMRDRDLNPKSWDQKVTFWTDVILSDCLHCKQAVVDVDQLKAKYKRKGKSPACLSNVVEEMLRNGQLQKVSDLNQNSSSSWLSWGYNKLVKAPVGWGLKLLPWQKTDQDVPEQFVVPDVIKSKASAVVEHHFNDDAHLDIIDYKELQEKSQNICASELEFTLVMRQLCESKRVIVQETGNDIKMVKFLKTDDRKKKIEKIDEQELRIHKIRQAHIEVKKQIEKLTGDVSSLAKEALAAKKQGLQKNAIRLMKKRAFTQHRIDELTGSLDTLENILYRIEQAGSNEMILRAIESGSDVLKDLTSRTTVEDVTSIMDELAEIQESQNDVSAQMNLPLPGVDEPSLDELEDELSELLKEDSPVDKPTDQKSPLSAREGQRASPKKIGFNLDAIGNPVEDDLDVSGELNEISALLNDLQLPDVPTTSPGGQTDKQTDTKKKQALAS